MTHAHESQKQLWEESYRDRAVQQAYNTAPVEALVRVVSYYLRDRFDPGELEGLHFLEMGCGTGPNLVWLAQKGIHVSGVDISGASLQLARQNLEHADLSHLVGRLVEAPVDKVPFEGECFDGIVEACVFQHLDRDQRRSTFLEVGRMLKPGGLFVGYMLDAGHTVFQAKTAEQLQDDPGSLVLQSEGPRIRLENIGLCHFFRKDEFHDLFAGFSVVDPCLTTYCLPQEEARKRGFDEYLQSMWTVYAVK